MQDKEQQFEADLTTMKTLIDSEYQKLQNVYITVREQIIEQFQNKQLNSLDKDTKYFLCELFNIFLKDNSSQSYQINFVVLIEKMKEILDDLYSHHNECYSTCETLQLLEKTSKEKDKYIKTLEKENNQLKEQINLLKQQKEEASSQFSTRTNNYNINNINYKENIIISPIINNNNNKDSIISKALREKPVSKSFSNSPINSSRTLTQKLKTPKKIINHKSFKVANVNLETRYANKQISSTNSEFLTKTSMHKSKSSYDLKNNPTHLIKNNKHLDNISLYDRLKNKFRNSSNKFGNFSKIIPGSMKKEESISSTNNEAKKPLIMKFSNFQILQKNNNLGNRNTKNSRSNSPMFRGSTPIRTKEKSIPKTRIHEETQVINNMKQKIANKIKQLNKK